jgi:hypothetical protein
MGTLFDEFMGDNRQHSYKIAFENFNTRRLSNFLIHMTPILHRLERVGTGFGGSTYATRRCRPCML